MSSDGNVQKILIPKGLVNPGQTTIVEIPESLQNVGTVVALPKEEVSSSGTYSSSSSASPSRPRVMKKRSFMRRTFPARSKSRHEHDQSRHTFGGFPGDYSRGAKSCPGSSGYDASMSNWSSGPGVYTTCSSLGTEPDSSLDPNYTNFLPPHHSSMRAYRKLPSQLYGPKTDFNASFNLSPMSDSDESPYMNFIPAYGSSWNSVQEPSPNLTDICEAWGAFGSSPENSYGGSPGGSYGGGAGSPCGSYGGSSGSPCGSYGGGSGSPSPYSSGAASGGAYGGTPASSSGDSYRLTCPAMTSSPGYASQASMSLSPLHESEMSSRRGYSSGGSGGAEPVVVSPPKLDYGDLLNSLDKLDFSELTKIMHDMKSFQSARRKLVFDASSLKSPSEFSQEFLSTSSNESEQIACACAAGPHSI